jgi:hypothetical protein
VSFVTYQYILSLVLTYFHAHHHSLKPVLLPDGKSSISVQSQFNVFLSSFLQADPFKLSHKNAQDFVRWSQTTISRFNHELLSLQGQLLQYSEKGKDDFEFDKRSKFATFCKTYLRKRMYTSIFSRFVFASKKEVTSTTEAVLTSLGLSQDCPLAIVALDDCFAAAMKGDGSQGSAIHILDEEESVSVLSGTDSSWAKVHLFDNPNDRRLLWFTHGLGAWVIKKLNECRNNLSSYVRQAVCECLCYCFSIS